MAVLPFKKDMLDGYVRVNSLSIFHTLASIYSTMALLYPPTSLTDLQALTDHATVLCVGESYPKSQKCSNMVTMGNDKTFRSAVDKLRSLSKHGLKYHDIGLMDTLKAVAKGFSCIACHRHSPGQREQLPYYWIALDSLPSFLDCMGLEGPMVDSCSDPKKAAVQLAVDGLDPEELWTVCEAMKHLKYNGHNEWWPKTGSGAVAEYFREILNNALKVDGTNYVKKGNFELAHRRWTAWHQSLHGSTGTSGEDDDNLSTILLLRERLSQRNLRDQQASLQNEAITLKRTGSSVSPPATTALSPSSEAMQTTATGVKPVELPRTRQARPAQSPSSSPISTPFRPNALGTQRRRVSAPQSKVDRPKTLQPQRRQAVSENYRSTRGQQASRERRSLQESPYLGLESTTSETDKDDVAAPAAVLHVKKSPEFEPHKQPKSLIEATRNVFIEMRKPLKDERKSDEGFIYAFSMPDCPGYIKIGRTRTAIRHREIKIKACTGIKLKLFNRADHCPVPNHTKLEALIHKSLQPFRRKFACASCKDFAEHDEWFEIDENQAIVTINRWRQWMRTNPYCNRQLKPWEDRRISLHDKRLAQRLAVAEDSDRGEGGGGKDIDSFDWDAFMRSSSSWELWWPVYFSNTYLYDERPERNDSSPRWNALWKHGPWNFVSFMGFFAVFLMVSFAARGFPWPGGVVWFVSGTSCLLSGLAVLNGL